MFYWLVYFCIMLSLGRSITFINRLWLLTRSVKCLEYKICFWLWNCAVY